MRLGPTQAGPVVGDLGLSREQRAQLAFLLCNENTDDLSAQLRHAYPARIGDAFEPDHRCRGDMKLHSELTAGTILGRQPRTQDDGAVDGELGRLDIPACLSDDLVTTQRAVDAAIRLLALVAAEVTHSSHARPRPLPRPRYRPEPGVRLICGGLIHGDGAEESTRVCRTWSYRQSLGGVRRRYEFAMHDPQTRFHLQDKPGSGACGKAPVVPHTGPSHQYGRRIPVSKSLDEGPFFHGTVADMSVGQLLVAGRPSNYRPEIVMNHIYFTALVDGAGLAAEIAAELAGGGAVPRVYQVEPTGVFENDPNVTDKKFPGNPTRSYRSSNPLRIVGEITEWTRLTPEQLQTWRKRLSALLSSDRGAIIN